MTTLSNDACLSAAIKCLYDVDIHYFEDVTRDSEELIRELNLEYKEIVFEDFKKDIDRIFSDLQHPYKFSRTNLMSAQKKLDKLTHPLDSEKNLVKLYKKAKKRTFWERIFRNNKADIIAFHHALQDVTVWKCRLWLEEQIKDIVKLDRNNWDLFNWK